MPRKFRATEISGDMTPGTGQHMTSANFCLNCHGVNKCYPDCTNPDIYAIPRSAEVPRRNAPKRIWEIFKKQFVYAKPAGFWVGDDRCWWYKNVYLKTKK